MAVVRLRIVRIVSCLVLVLIVVQCRRRGVVVTILYICVYRKWWGWSISRIVLIIRIIIGVWSSVRIGVLYRVRVETLG
jgi:hypothetical protein